MSFVTNVILLCSTSEDQGEDQFPAVDELNAWLIGNGQHAGLNRLNGHEGGHKAWEADVFGGAFNYLPTAEFIEQVATAKWETPLKVQLLIKNQDDDTWKMVVGPCA